MQEQRGLMINKTVSRALVASAILAAGNVPVRAAGDPAAGERVFNKVCIPCHSNEPGVNKTGPSLFGVVGRKAGSADFSRYKGLVGADFSWDPTLLDQYLQDPKAFVMSHTRNKTTAMAYSLRDPQQRNDVIAYLMTLR
jgi:cytochrome c